MRLYTNRCACNAKLIEDIERGEYICTKCGCVVEESIPISTPEFVSSDPEEKLKKARCGAPTKYSQHDLGLVTDIPNTNRDCNGNRIDVDIEQQISSIRRWNKRIRVSTARDRRRSNVLAKINEFCSYLSLPDSVNQTAALFYRKYDNNNAAKGKSVISMALASVYLACKKYGIIKSLEEISEACNIHDARAKRLAFKYYRELLMVNDSIDDIYNNTLDKHIAKIVNISNLDTKVERLAIEFANKTNDSSLMSGKAPNGLAAAYVYVAATLLGVNMYQKDITTSSSVSEVTIRNRCKEIITSHKIRLLVKCKS